MKLATWRNPPYEGVNLLGRVRDEMERAFGRVLPEAWEFPWTGRNGGAWMPPLDVAESENEITIKADIPGVAMKDVDVSLSGNLLTLTGHKDETKEEKGEDYFVSERHFGSFRRSIELPQGIDPEKVSAEQHNGVLTVKVAKVKSAKPKHVPVREATTR